MQLIEMQYDEGTHGTDIHASTALSEVEMAELRDLRRRQIEGDFGPEDRLRLRELNEREQAVKSGVAGKAGARTEQEEEEYLDLTRRQTSGENWSPEAFARMQELEKKAKNQIF